MLKLMNDRKPITDLRNYNLAVIYNHEFMGFANLFVTSLLDNKILFRTLCIGNAGLTEEDIAWFNKTLRGNIIVVDLPYKEQGANHQSEEYRKILDNRPFFWYYMADLNVPFVHLDGDTAILSNDFSLLDFEADVTVTVREAGAATQTDHRPDKEYVNCGVTFYHHPEQCTELLSLYHAIMRDMYQGQPFFQAAQYDQPAFYRAVKTMREYAICRIQNVHGRYYNCWSPEEINNRTSILHFKNDKFNRTFEERVERLVGKAQGETK